MKTYLLGGLISAAIIASPAYLWANEPHSKHLHQSKQSVYANKQLLTLKEAVNKAIENAPSLASNAYAVQSAKASETQAGVLPNPEAYFEAENILGSGAYNDFDSAEYSLGISQKIELGGKRTARKNVAKAQTNKISALSTLEQLKLERDVHVAYANILTEEEGLRLAKSQQDVARKMLKTVSRRVSKAAEADIQKTKAELALSSAKIKVRQSEQRLSIAQKRLANLIGESELLYALDHSHLFDIHKPSPLDDYLAKIDTLPDVAQFQYLEQEKQAELDYELAHKVPDPELSLGVRHFSDSDDNAFMVGVSMPIPIHNQNHGNIAKANAELSKVSSDKNVIKRSLEQEIINQWQSLETAYIESKELRWKLIPSAEKAFKQASSNYERGKFSYLEVLDAQRTLAEVKEQYYQSLKNYHIAQANIERLTSGE